MSWNYRITRRWNTNAEAPIFEIREFYYGDDGSIRGWTDPVVLKGDSPDEIKADLELILRDTFDRPVIDLTNEDSPREV